MFTAGNLVMMTTLEECWASRFASNEQILLGPRNNSSCPEQRVPNSGEFPSFEPSSKCGVVAGRSAKSPVSPVQLGRSVGDEADLFRTGVKKRSPGVLAAYSLAMGTRAAAVEMPCGRRTSHSRSFPSTARKSRPVAGGWSMGVSRIRKSGPSWPTESVFPASWRCIFTSAEWPV
jgi:hypothetical protein